MKRPLTVTLNFKYLKEMFRAFLFFGTLKNTWLFVYVRIRIFSCHFIIWLQEWRNSLTYFATLVLTRCFNHAFLFSDSTFEVHVFLIYVGEETYVIRKFTNFWKFLRRLTIIRMLEFSSVFSSHFTKVYSEF